MGVYNLHIINFSNNTYEDKDLTLNGYSLLRADHPDNVKRGEVCIYYKETLALKMIPNPYLNERLFFEVTIEALRHGCSPEYLLHIFRTPFLKNTY